MNRLLSGALLIAVLIVIGMLLRAAFTNNQEDAYAPPVHVTNPNDIARAIATYVPQAGAAVNNANNSGNNTNQQSGNDNSGQQTSSGASAPKLVGKNVWQGEQLDLPISVGSDETYYAHGDLAGDGSCSLQVWGPGEQITDLSNGTWKLYRVTGGTEQQRLAKVPSVGDVCG